MFYTRASGLYSVTDPEHFGSPLEEGLLLSTHLVAGGEFEEPLAPQLPQQVVHVRTEGAEIGVSAGPQGKHGEPSDRDGESQYNGNRGIIIYVSTERCKK